MAILQILVKWIFCSLFSLADHRYSRIVDQFAFIFLHSQKKHRKLKKLRNRLQFQIVAVLWVFRQINSMTNGNFKKMALMKFYSSETIPLI